MSNLSKGLKNEYKKAMFFGFVKNAVKFPERTAVIHCSSENEERKITYGTLLKNAVCMAEELRSRCCSKSENIGIVFPRGIEQITLILAVQMSGCAYVPIRTTQPTERIKKIINRAGIKRIVAYDDFIDEGLNEFVEIIKWNRLVSVNDISLLEAVDKIIFPNFEDTAYIIFTSGSTGEPKGVEIQHGAALNTVLEINNRFDISENDVAINVSSYDFDLSVYDIFGMLNVGGTVVTIDDTISKEPNEWFKFVNKFGVTIWNSVPAIFEMLCIVSGNKLPKSLKYVFLSGDWVSKDVYFRLDESKKNIRFAALGGATEASVWSNIYEVTEDDRKAEWSFVPYGKALPGQKYIIINENGSRCSLNERGELWIGGCGLAKGYIGNTAETDAHFVKRDGETWYRTGDVGYFDENDDIIFCGRMDNQVKINGFRIEIGEIESELNRIEGIKKSAVIKIEEKGNSLLAAAVVTDKEDFSSDEVKVILKSKLPAYMIPERIKCTERLPLTDNGKCDRKKLEKLLECDCSAGNELPESDTEKKLAELWKKILNSSDIGKNDNFFELGGNSLKATTLISEIENNFLINFTLGNVFQCPVLETMAAEIDNAVSAGRNIDIIEGEI